jgi:hypothetical protein
LLLEALRLAVVIGDFARSFPMSLRMSKFPSRLARDGFFDHTGLKKLSEKRPPANFAGAHGWRFRWESAGNGETRRCRNYGQLRSCKRRSRLTNGLGKVLKMKLAPQPKQRVFCPLETLAKSLVQNGLGETANFYRTI